jgi:iron complex transport system substrate-binding protein
MGRLPRIDRISQYQKLLTYTALFLFYKNPEGNKMKNYVGKILWLTCAALMALSGCGGASRQSPGQSESRDFIYPERIVSGFYISSSICIALGLADRLVGIEARANSRPIYALAAPHLLDLPDIGTARNFNLEACLALEPDLVILPLRLRDSADILMQLGIPVLLVNPEDHENLVDMISMIGDLTGTRAAADRLISYYHEALSAITALTGELTDLPTVYLCGLGNYLTTVSSGMYQATLINAAGGVNIAADLQGDSWVSVSYEQLILMNPDVIVIPAEASYSKEDILSDAQLTELRAIREGRVFQMPRDFEAWDSPVPSGILGIKWLLSVLHGSVYSMESFQMDAAAFYKEFYKVEIDTGLIGK